MFSVAVKKVVYSLNKIFNIRVIDIYTPYDIITKMMQDFTQFAVTNCNNDKYIGSKRASNRVSV